MRDIYVAHTCVLDSDPESARIFLEVFEAQNVKFASVPAEINPPSTGPAGERSLLGIDISMLIGAWQSSLKPHLKNAAAVVLRSKLGDFFSDRRDLIDLTQFMAVEGFRLFDVLQQAADIPARAAMQNVFFAYERDLTKEDNGGDHRNRRLYRVSEALNDLSRPIALESNLLRQAGRGSDGFSAGVSNPGAIQLGDRVILLARGERSPWLVQKFSRDCFLSSCQPMLLELEKDLAISGTSEVRVAGDATKDGIRFEDFRLFSHGDSVYSNHALIHLGEQFRSRNPICHEGLRTSVGISQLDAGTASLTHLGVPRLDRPVARREKNWAFLSASEDVHLIYSFNPYRLFSTSEFPKLDFRFNLERRLSLPLSDDGLPIRNSINPVSYDADHFLHVVHKVYPEKHYVFWAVLIDKTTLVPVKMGSRPLLRAGASATCSIIYACSVICQADDIIVFGGVDDCSIGTWRVARSHLDRHWAPIALLN